MKTKILLLFLILFLPYVPSLAQKANKKITVTGLVTDAEHRPVGGAIIMVDGNKTNVTTNVNGKYKIRVRPDADTITIITFNNGMAVAPIGGKTTVNFTLSRTAAANQNNQTKRGEENVNIGYGSVKQKELITPVSTVSGQQGKYAAYTDIYEILKGLPGVQVNGRTIVIQGQSSINLSTQPLFIVDGQVTDFIDRIPPYMIDRISVLKGSSASIYGARGANGVILITLMKTAGK